MPPPNVRGFACKTLRPIVVRRASGGTTRHRENKRMSAVQFLFASRPTPADATQPIGRTASPSQMSEAFATASDPMSGTSWMWPPQRHAFSEVRSWKVVCGSIAESGARAVLTHSMHYGTLGCSLLVRSPRSILPKVCSISSAI